MQKQTHRNTLTQLSVSDIRGIAQLVTQATIEVSNITEGVHQSIWNTLGVPGGKEPGQTRGITGFVYRTVRQVTGVCGQGVDMALRLVQPALRSTEKPLSETPQRAAVISALNGVMGDYLQANDSPFIIPMCLRYQDEVLTTQTTPIISENKNKILLMIHGLCMNDLQWQTSGQQHSVNHGEAVADALGYTPLYLRYNSGLHISQNGRELSIKLEQLLTNWAQVPESLSVIAHSMGGLLIRSAVHYAQQQKMHWPKVLKNIVFLGTPHHGAPLEQIGNWVDIILGSTPYTAPFVKLSQMRSVGITDLRYGAVIDEHWHENSKANSESNADHHLPLPHSVACYCIAATTASKRSNLSERVIGDGLVPVQSALGQHKNPSRHLQFKKSSQWVAYGVNHMELLNQVQISHRIIQWLQQVQA